jgi:AraC-like DNA-binding protein
MAPGLSRNGRLAVQRDIAAQRCGTTENEEVSQRVGLLAEVPGLLRELGADPADVIASAGLDPDGLDDPENWIAFVTIGRLLHACAVKTGCQHFALLVGQRTRISHLGLPGQLALRSPTLGAALRIFAVYQHLNSQGVVTSLQEKDGVAMVGPVIYQKVAEHVEHMYDLSVAATLSFVRELVGARWRPERVLFSHSKPAHASVYRSIFQATCQFDAERTALVFPARMLDRELASGDPEQLRTLEAQAQARNDLDFDLRLRRTLRTMLLAQSASAEQVAQLLLIHRRTLNRRLKAEGTTFQAILDEVRFETACELLDTARIPVSKIAVALGYSETSAFSRAFRRWSGATPVERRRRYQKRAPEERPTRDQHRLKRPAQEGQS